MFDDSVISGRWVARRPAHTLPERQRPYPEKITNTSSDSNENVEPCNNVDEKFNSQVCDTHMQAKKFPLLGKKIWWIISVIASLLLLLWAAMELQHVLGFYDVIERYAKAPEPHEKNRILHYIAYYLITYFYPIAIFGGIMYLSCLGTILIGLYNRSVYRARWDKSRPSWQLILFSVPPIAIVGIPLLVYEYAYLLRVLYSQWKLYLMQQRKLRIWLIVWSVLSLYLFIIALQWIFGSIHWFYMYKYAAGPDTPDSSKPWLISFIESLMFNNYLQGIYIFKEITAVFSILCIGNIWYTFITVGALSDYDYENYCIGLGNDQARSQSQSKGNIPIADEKILEIL